MNAPDVNSAAPKAKVTFTATADNDNQTKTVQSANNSDPRPTPSGTAVAEAPARVGNFWEPIVARDSSLKPLCHKALWSSTLALVHTRTATPTRASSRRLGEAPGDSAGTICCQ